MAGRSRASSSRQMAAPEPTVRRWILAAAIALGIGMVIAVLYAMLQFSIGRDSPLVLALIGGFVGFALYRALRKGGVGVGILAVLLTVQAHVASYIMIVSMYATGSISSGLTAAPTVDPGLALEIYFQNDLRYLWLAFGIFGAFIVGGKFNPLRPRD